MLYFILRPLTRIALKAYFRRITINGLENLPKDAPVIICSNHPTGFIEPCLMACFLPRTLHFLVRGDLFEKPVLGKLLISTNQIPIYRRRDGYEKLRGNRNLMNISYEKLLAGEAILIFPEASTIETKYLRPIKKGAARMALETLEKHPEMDLSVLPVGINYSGPNRWRSYVNINIGKPIRPSLPEDHSQLPKVIRTLTNEINEKLNAELLILNEGVDPKDLDAVLDLGQWEMPVKTSLKVRHEEPNKFQQERAISLNLKAPVDLSEIKELTTELHRFDNKPVGIFELIFGALIFIPVLIFLALNAIPVLIGIKIRDKYVGVNEFVASIAIAASLGVYLILFPIVFIILLFIMGWWAFFMFTLPILGLIGLMGRDYLKNLLHRLKLRSKLGESKMAAIFENGMQILKKVRG